MIHLTYLRILMGSKYEDAMASSEDPDQTAPLRGAEEQSDLGLHCLPRHVFSKNLGS